MKRIIIVALVLAWSLPATAQTPHVADNVPPDQPFTSGASDTIRVEEAIKPYVEKARRSYPDAKKRFLAGLPAKHSFFVTTRLRDEKGNFEQVFIAVESIDEGHITGRIWSHVLGAKGYKYGDRYTFPESQLIDWLITRPDGSEEGNFVGNFLDEYQKTVTQGATQRGGAPDRR